MNDFRATKKQKPNVYKKDNNVSLRQYNIFIDKIDRVGGSEVSCWWEEGLKERGNGLKQFRFGYYRHYRGHYYRNHHSKLEQEGGTKRPD